MADEIYSSSYWGNGVCDNDIGWGGVYKDVAGCTPAFSNTYSMNFDGVDDVITLDATFDATGGLTFSCWVNYTAASAGSLNWLCSNGGIGGSGSQFNTRLVSDGRWICYFNGSPQSTGITGLNDGNWHHIAQTVNYSTGDVKFYKDGVVSSTVLTGGSGHSTAILKNIGASIVTTSTIYYPYGGYVDELAVFESIKTISDLYNSGEPANLSSLSPALWLRMGEEATWDGSKWTLTDQGSGGNNAESVNMVEADRESETP